jgi:hypothetical protein
MKNELKYNKSFNSGDGESADYLAKLFIFTGMAISLSVFFNYCLNLLLS